ncbi:hypothetical protein ACQP1K_27925 [Sphaerimonospora sp. CA-214678]|uniref:hypothetical protein n=1 Tax=Sphaerimonospora sp. CA-214678 TaxID=3240029 RepID=UPI003D8C9BDC
MNSTFLRSAVDQFRMHATSPIAILSTLALPCVFAFVIHSSRAGSTGPTGTTSDLAVGSAGIGILDSAIVLVVLSLLGEKQWKTLYAALGSPGGMVPLVLGRLTGIAVQTLVTVPGAFVVLILIWGLDDGFAWGRWLVGGVLLAVSTTAVVGLLAVAVLRLPYSSGMVNGLTGLIMALSALVVPQSALPESVQVLAQSMPQAHVMTWVRGGSAGSLATAVALTVGYAVVVVLLLRRVEYSARRRAVPMEM